MQTYRVVWEMEIDAESHIDAAVKALRIHRDADSIATVFTIHEPGDSVGIRVDLDDLDDAESGVA